MSLPIPRGFAFAGVHCGIKREPTDLDFALFVSERPSTAAGVYTQNRVIAAPVVYDRQRTPSDHIQAVAVNSGNANACTAEAGTRDSLAMAELTAAALSQRGSSVPVTSESVLVMSTGVIGVPLPMANIQQGIGACMTELGGSSQHAEAAARAMMTTDLVPKLAGRTLKIPACCPAEDETERRLLGFAKGSGMIAPNMATMLAVLCTDANLRPADAQSVLCRVVAETFNCVRVDGHTSTNDTVLLLANGITGPSLSGAGLQAFETALHEVCTELARAIADDGEGATHLITVEVCGADSDDLARQIARCVVDSPLVKTAVTGGDANWGRIVSAAGYAGVDFDPNSLGLHLQGVCLYENNTPVPFDEQQVSTLMKDRREVLIQLSVGKGPGRGRIWSCDLTADYIRINADYRT